MERFSAEFFYLIGRSLAEVSSLRPHGGDALSAYEQVLDRQINSDDRVGFIKLLGEVRIHVLAIKLMFSVTAIDRLIASLAPGQSITKRTVIAELTSLQDRINDELATKMFLYMPSDRAEYYQNPKLLGNDVLAKFPTLQYDITEAGNCLATGRSTAVVFHLMRIMETAVQQFGAKLGVSLANEKNWQNILDEINKAIKALQPKVPQTVAMTEASANLYAVKLAWRNQVMHPNDTYTLEEAENLIRQVKIFMGQLATII
jgi:hypothetical protein